MALLLGSAPAVQKAPGLHHAVSQRGSIACGAAPKRSANLFAWAPALFSAPAAFADELGIDTSSLSVPSVDLTEVNQAISGLSDVDPLLLLGGATAVAIPLLIAGVSGAVGGGAKSVSAAKALDILAQEPQALLLDIRNSSSIKAAGSPDLRSVKRKSVSLPFTKVAGEEVTIDERFADRFSKLSTVKEDSTVILFDAFGQDAPKAAKTILEVADVKLVYVQDGAEGARGWKTSGMPWKEPAKGLSLPDFSSFGANIDSLAEDFKAAVKLVPTGLRSQASPTMTKAGLALGAVAVASVALFNELEVVLELAGVVAATQFLAKNLLFAKDRKQTVSQLKELVDEKIKAGDAADDLKKLAEVILSEDTVDAAAKAGGKAKAKVKEAAGDVQAQAKEAADDVQTQAKEQSEAAKTASPTPSTTTADKVEELAKVEG